ncbi:MAG: 4Fe-4S binding protein, partial [Candidatus Pacebacteria bacterium]|nr:4Fe-4S binding protein [Candidatus Paceibacterota bacterium]
LLDEYEKTNQCRKFGDNIIVLGINDASLLASRLALRCGSKHIEMYHKDSKSNITTVDSLLRRSREEGIRMNYFSDVNRIILDKKEAIQKIEFVKTKHDARTGKLIMVENSEFIVEADTIICADYDYEVISVGNCAADSLESINNENVFHYGDGFAANRFNVLDTIENAKSVSNRIYEYIFNSYSGLFDINSEQDMSGLSAVEATIDGNNATSKFPVRCSELPFAKRIASFEPVLNTYTNVEVKNECERCFRCSHKIEMNDTASCISCGVCVDICPTSCFEQTRILHPFIETTRKNYNHFFQTLLGLSDDNISEYSADSHSYINANSLCIRCLRCVNNCPVNIISVKKIIR